VSTIRKRYIALILVILTVGCESSGGLRNEINETMSRIIPRRTPENVEKKMNTSETVTTAEKITVTVAILPLSNSTLDIEGPDIVRGALVAAFTRKGFAVQPIDTTNTLLRERAGITLGGQFDIATPQMIGDVLCVDTLLYGKLVDYQMSMYGAYRINRVRGIFHFIDSTTGGMISEFGRGVRGEHLAEVPGGTAGASVTAVGFLTMLGNRLVNIGDNDPQWETFLRFGNYYKKEESERNIEDPDLPDEVTQLAELVATALTSTREGSFSIRPPQLRSRTCTTS
jgi:hypothetical protein